MIIAWDGRGEWPASKSDCRPLTKPSLSWRRQLSPLLSALSPPPVPPPSPPLPRPLPVLVVTETCPTPVGIKLAPPVMVSLTPASLPVLAILMVQSAPPPDLLRFTLSTRTPPEPSPAAVKLTTLVAVQVPEPTMWSGPEFELGV